MHNAPLYFLIYLLYFKNSQFLNCYTILNLILFIAECPDVYMAM
jgi:hypothetical protein